jgi:phenylacetic acid degradation operon negative regulatory protein
MSIESASRSRRTLRTGSLITTVFGDAIAPRGGTVWLGSLITAMRDFGASERLVRTSVYRLVQDGWLQSTQIGRRSYYSLTDEGRERFALATHRIYGQPVAEWDGTWCLVLLSGLDANSRETVRKELGWLGFGALSSDLLAHPAPEHTDVEVALARLGLAGQLPVLSAETLRSEPAMRALVQRSWNLDEIDERYASFVQRFQPLIAAYRPPSNPSPKTAFLVRTLLIQEYRKVMLRDPQLPAELLPATWHGTAAYRLCRNLYCATYQAADEYLSAVMETASGPLPPADEAFRHRFGGLDA